MHTPDTHRVPGRPHRSRKDREEACHRSRTRCHITAPGAVAPRRVRVGRRITAEPIPVRDGGARRCMVRRPAKRASRGRGGPAGRAGWQGGRRPPLWSWTHAVAGCSGPAGYGQPTRAGLGRRLLEPSELWPREQALCQSASRARPWPWSRPGKRHPAGHLRDAGSIIEGSPRRCTAPLGCLPAGSITTLDPVGPTPTSSRGAGGRRRRTRAHPTPVPADQRHRPCRSGQSPLLPVGFQNSVRGG
jgi:hypothetical protein